jgi:hypothetical protein
MFHRLISYKFFESIQWNSMKFRTGHLPVVTEKKNPPIFHRKFGEFLLGPCRSSIPPALH